MNTIFSIVKKKPRCDGTIIDIDLERRTLDAKRCKSRKTRICKLLPPKQIIECHAPVRDCGVTVAYEIKTSQIEMQSYGGLAIKNLCGKCEAYYAKQFDIHICHEDIH